MYLIHSKRTSFSPDLASSQPRGFSPVRKGGQHLSEQNLTRAGDKSIAKCKYHIKGYCKFQEGCNFVHANPPNSHLEWSPIRPQIREGRHIPPWSSDFSDTPRSPQRRIGRPFCAPRRLQSPPRRLLSPPTRTQLPRRATFVYQMRHQSQNMTPLSQNMTPLSQNMTPLSPQMRLQSPYRRNPEETLFPTEETLLPSEEAWLSTGETRLPAQQKANLFQQVAELQPQEAEPYWRCQEELRS